MSNLLGLLYLSSTAKRHGHKVRVLDALREGAGTVEGIRYRNTPLYLVGLSYDEIISRIPQDTDCVAISAPFTNLHFVVDELARRIRENRPDILLALGGGLPSAHPASRSYDSSFDVVVAGEGEIVFSEFLDHPRKKAGGEAPKYLEGIPVENLDALPIPDRNLIPSEYFQMSARKRSSLPLRIPYLNQSVWIRALSHLIPRKQPIYALEPGEDKYAMR